MTRPEIPNSPAINAHLSHADEAIAVTRDPIAEHITQHAQTWEQLVFQGEVLATIDEWCGGEAS